MPRRSYDENMVRYYSRRFVFSWFPKLVKAVLVASGIGLTGLIFSEVLLRYIFHLSLLWVEEIAIIPSFWLYMLGASYGSYERTHIRTDVVGLLIKDERKKLRARIITAFVTVAIAVLFAKWGIGFFQWDLQMHQLSYTLLLPLIWARSSIFVGSIIMASYFLIELIDLVGQYFGKEPLVFKTKVD